MKFIRNTARKLQTAGELLHFFGKNKRWWLLPILLTLFMLGALIVVAQSSSLAPCTTFRPAATKPSWP